MSRKLLFNKEVLPRRVGRLLLSPFSRKIRQLRTLVRFWKEYLFAGEPELRILKKFIRNNSVAIDVGGNSGTYTYHMSRLAENVITFEPNPFFANMIRNFGLSRVNLQQVALSGSEYEANLRIPLVGQNAEDQGMGSLECQAVPNQKMSRELKVLARSLDSYNLARVSFVKIDVEGHEEAVLQGAMETIRQSRPVLLIEIEERHNPGGLLRIFARLRSERYKAFFFDGKKLNFVSNMEEFGAKVGASTRNVRGAALYINNFIFIPDTNLECRLGKTADSQRLKS